ncbi:hypothetical protein HG536_0A03380 [Torulaspora globosa]|uniref:Nucleoporin POM152 n=1 Tax=Torulaspora globosa TaxID=48254 RepID=A0A7G3ZAI4_9SACH|nr:uncharacterized protein HG536_0A03380 [Torulaspora globosa]QLL30520.1 hypothetical protein HG536_0A03380 [Torulaspora globosa]
MLNSNTPRGNHWIGASSTSSTYQAIDGRTSGSQEWRFRSSKSYDRVSSTLSDGRARGDTKYTLGPDGKRFGELQSQPLISPEVLEASRQRALALLIFAIIQGYKVYDLIVLKNKVAVVGRLFDSSRLSFIFKYLIIDSLFLYFLPSFKIPKLTFQPWAVTVQIVAMTVITVLISNEHGFALLSVFGAAWRKLSTKEVSLTGSSVNMRKVMDSSSHFRGALTIKILPENTAMFNPLHDSFCLPMDASLVPEGHVKVPIRINSTADISLVQLEYRDIYTDRSELRNLTSKEFRLVEDLSGLLSRDRLMSQRVQDTSTIRYIELPLNDVGFYQIKKIVDTKDFSLKVYQSHLVIPYCPVASITGHGSSDRCIGDSDRVSLEVQGVPPMKLTYTKSINGKARTYVDTNLVPEFFETPLQSTRKHIFSATDLSDLKWGRNYPVTINLDTTASQDGHYVYKIDKLVDGLGNVMDFTKIPEALQEDYQVSYDFKVHEIPRGSLDEKFDPKSSTKRAIVVKFEKPPTWEDSAPYSANISFVDEKQKLHLRSISTTSHHASFQAESPGTYKLEGISSKHCPGVVIGKSSILITKPVPPQLDVKSTPILDQCVGQVGLNFDLTFTGAPPFQYMAMIYKMEENKKWRLYDTKRYTSEGTRSQFSYNPTIEGNYEIVFDHLTNKLFTDQISLVPREKYTFKTSMRVKPSAKFKTLKEVELCLGEQTKVPVTFHGEPPFSLTYDIVETSSNKRSSRKVDNLLTYDYEIEIPRFEVGGDYIVSLVSVKDSSDCLVGLSEPDARIKIRRDIPSAAFNLLDNSNQVKIKQGSQAHIPLKLAGEAPFTVKYEHFDSHGQLLGVYETQFHSSYKPVLKVSNEGRYKLVDVRDSSCSGIIEDPESHFEVGFLDKPSFTVVANSKIEKVSDTNFVKHEVCQGTESVLDLALSGSPPFSLRFDLVTPNGHSISKAIQVATKYATIRLRNEEPGEHIVIISALYDSNYGEEDFSKASYSSPEVIVKQKVNPLPEVKFSDSGKIFRACSTAVNEETSSLAPISLRFNYGEAPFSVTFSIYHESTSRTEHCTIDKIVPGSFNYRRLYENLKLGNHLIAIEKVVDANGCANDKIATENEHVWISVTDVPKIHLLDPTADYCVGDYVAYQLSGNAPFNIRYEFNGAQLKLKEHTSQFVRLATEPGTISILSIGDSTSQCMVDFTKPNMKKEFDRLSLVVHPIPSVTVSQGQNAVEDIHEGDQAEVIFSFEGTPPFSLTYVRTEEAEGRKRPQIVETHKVTDIHSFEYRVLTSLQGTYEAIEISDAFCFAKNDAFFHY